jgi:hypothetical protein
MKYSLRDFISQHYVEITAITLVAILFMLAV